MIQDDGGLSKRRQSMAIYGNDSVYARIAYAPWFQHTTLVIIVLNAIWIGIDVQANHPVYKEQSGDDKLPLQPYSDVVENLFCGYFSIELVIRFLAYRRKCDCFKDHWFVFDGLLVLFMVIETWILAIINAIIGGGSDGLLSKFSALRLLRLLRLTRMARLMREVPELLTLVKGMISATRAVSFILMFLVLCMYVFAIVFTAQLGDPNAPEHKYDIPYWDEENGRDPTGVELFGSIGDSMMSLFTRGMLADNLAETLIAIKDQGGKIECDMTPNATTGEIPALEDACARLDEGSLLLMWAFILFMIISAFCLLNMLIGVLCEVIQDSAERENESTQISELRHHMSQAFQLIDTSKDGLITSAEWSKMKLEKTVRSSMANLGVEEQHMEERLDQMQESLFGAIDEDEAEGDESSIMDANRNGLTFDQFIEKVVEIRPDTPASALDIEILRVRVEREEKTFNARLDFIEQALANTAPATNPPPAQANTGSRAPEPKAVVPDYRNPASDWLRDVPTEVLFAILNSRAPPELGPPKVLSNREEP